MAFSLKRYRRLADQQVKVWNARNSVGTLAPTRSEAWVLDSGAAVVMVEGVTGAWSLDAITIAPKEE